MTPTIYRYRIGRKVSPKDVEETLLLALVAAEGLYGAARVEMEAACHVDPDSGCGVIDASNEVGRDVARIFTCFLIHEFGRDAVEIRQVARGKSDTAKGDEV
jgi:hypothetical protein